MMHFELPSSDPERLFRAFALAESFARERITERTIGVVFLGGLARGYFDADSDIDIAFFEDKGPDRVRIRTEIVEGFELQTFVADFEREASAEWDMSKRWAYSSRILHHDREGRTENLLRLKVPLRAEERRWLMISGITLSEWYCNRLPDVWIRRGDILSSHHMFNEGLNRFLSAAFALNEELVPDHKWLLWRAARLKIAPSGFGDRLGEILLMREASLPELERRRSVFMSLWNEMLPLIEAEAGMKYEEFKDTV
jgi:predicted nucleotidyltransferase